MKAWGAVWKPQPTGGPALARAFRLKPPCLAPSACLGANPARSPPCQVPPPTHLQFLFKRYLEYEKNHGTPATVEHVKRRAMEYVEQAAAA